MQKKVSKLRSRKDILIDYYNEFLKRLVGTEIDLTGFGKKVLIVKAGKEYEFAQKKIREGKNLIKELEMKLEITKSKKGWWITCQCGNRFFRKIFPDKFKCPACEKTFTIFKIKEKK